MTIQNTEDALDRLTSEQLALDVRTQQHAEQMRAELSVLNAACDFILPLPPGAQHRIATYLYERFARA